ncbi:hypothetical protein J7U46_03145 [Pelomonas sp. V22]|uniref:hypothetical protein n=1 Tax=Pelomonas sp. V22 TaxID=2822139 RepID=UPI0024A7E5E0|nr:hypothetical protein [Pelomonas sp. V22]MDI4632037.1 hypothetical protein [Pelomonas sp. V22]
MSTEPVSGRGLAMVVLWPAFLMAGVLEALIFAGVDPSDLWVSERLGLSIQGTYTLCFLVLWLVISIACGISVLLARLPDEEEKGRRNAPHWPR